MTKRRDPASFADAVTKIAGLLTYAALAEMVGKSERAVRNWSDPETGAVPSIEDAWRMDAAYLSAGGGKAPMLTVYALRLEIAAEAATDVQAIVEATGKAAIEGGEGIAALVAASRPGATKLEKQIARREALEASEAFAVAAQRIGGEE